MEEKRQNAQNFTHDIFSVFGKTKSNDYYRKSYRLPQRADKRNECEKPEEKKKEIIEKDSYFIPSGYDSLGLLRDADTAGDLKKTFEDEVKVEKKKERKKEEPEIECEDTNSFLKKIKDDPNMQLNKSSIIDRTHGGHAAPISQSDKFKMLSEQRKSHVATNMPTTAAPTTTNPIVNILYFIYFNLF